METFQNYLPHQPNYLVLLNEIMFMLDCCSPCFNQQDPSKMKRDIWNVVQVGAKHPAAVRLFIRFSIIPMFIFPILLDNGFYFVR